MYLDKTQPAPRAEGEKGSSPVFFKCPKGCCCPAWGSWLASSTTEGAEAAALCWTHPPALCSEPLGAPFELLNNNTEISCNICSQSLFLGGNVCD